MLEWLPEQASTYAGDIDSLISFIYYLMLIWFFLIHGLMFYMFIRFRRKADRRASFLDGHTLRQSAWILIPCIIVLGLDFWIDLQGGRVWALIKETSPEPDLSVQVIGKQFNWDMIYPGPDDTFGTDDDLLLENSLHVPVDRVVRVFLKSKDVLHSFFLPEFRLKQDAVPGRTIPIWFEATKTGRYELACAELCGFGHTTMQGLVTVHTQEDWEVWVEKKWPGGE